MKWLRRSLVLLLALCLLLVLAFWIYTRRASPEVNGTLSMSGLAGEVRIERDGHGIPSIRAGSLRDLMFGLGVAHAQDRLWQLETHKRIGSGRLAEAFGEGALETDRFLRALGVRRAAAAQWEAIKTKGSAESRDALEGYSAGINQVLRQHLGARTPEMLILGLPLEDWSPVDSLAWSIMMSWDLGGNWSSELFRMRMATKLSVARIDELLPAYPGEKPLATADYAALYRGLKLDAKVAGLNGARAASGEGMAGGSVDFSVGGSFERSIDRLVAAAPSSGIEGVGSNNWVVAGSHTTTGKPLLANDPHLKLSAPALWYFARLEAPGIKVAGATMPGLPLVVLGQNEQVAWGFTNTGPDVQDLYLERIKPDDAGQYQMPDGSFASFETVEERIVVKGQPEVLLKVRVSRHGPVISDAGGVADDVIGASKAADGKPVDDKAGEGRGGYALAMRWTALDTDTDPVAVGLALNRAKSVDDFIAAASAGWVSPMQNMVVADRGGRIGVVSPGRVPVRKPEHDLMGLVPAPGWDARYDWAGWVPAGETPREVDPPRGWIATANQRIHAPGYPHFITSEWALPYRQQRVEQMLQAQPKHSLDSLREMHADELSLAAQKLLPWLAKAKSQHPLAPAAMQQLQGFDGRMAANRAAPLIYWAWVRQLTSGVFADEVGAGDFFTRTLGTRSFRDGLEAVLERGDAWWCDDKATPAAETCAMQNDAAFTRALDELQTRFGADPARWQWGAAHQARSEHRPFSRVKALAGMFELRAPVGGDTYTINVSRVGLRPDATTGELYLDEHGPSLRALYDLADLSQSRVMHSSGQSGLPWSAHYRDFVAPWARVEYVPLWGRGDAAATLVLKPGG